MNRIYTEIEPECVFAGHPHVRRVSAFIAGSWIAGLRPGGGGNLCTSFCGAGESFRWKGRSFDEYYSLLLHLQDRARLAIRSGRPDQLGLVCRYALELRGVTVLGGKGNIMTLTDHPGELAGIMDRFLQFWETVCTQGCHLEGMTGIRCDSGFSLIYSMIAEGFVLYDGCTAAGLAGMIHKAFEGAEVPEMMRIRIPGQPSRPGPQTAHPAPLAIFGKTRKCEVKHLISNVKASWILGAALREIRMAEPHITLRHLEAALFMSGQSAGTRGKKKNQ